MRRQIGLTLVEVMTVMLIILILYAATVPVIFQTREKSYQTVCASNMHELYLGLELYQQDNGELPWISTVDPNFLTYIGGTEVKCPRLRNSMPPQLSYQNHSNIPKLPGPFGVQITSAFRECQRIRGDTIPFITDENHKTPWDGYKGLGERMLLVRGDGAFASVPWEPLRTSPCSAMMGFLNY